MADTGVINAVYQPLEDGLDKVGLMRGKYAPGLRFLTGASLTAATLWVIQPSWAFDASGNPKSWAVTATGDKTQTTLLPWWLVSIGGGFALGFLI